MEAVHKVNSKYDNHKQGACVMEIAHTRSSKYDNLKLILMLLTVIGHYVEPHVNQSQFAGSAFIFIYAFHMPLFIFLSGLFAKSSVNSKRFRWERVLAYLALYIVLKLLYYFVSKLLGLKAEFHLLYEKGLPWFMLASAVFLITARIVRRVKPSVAISASIIVACLAGFVNSIGDFLALSRILVFMPFFLMGFYLDAGKLLKWLSGKRLILPLSLCALLLLALLSTAGFNLFYKLRPLFTGRNSYSALAVPSLGVWLRLLSYPAIACVCLALIRLAPSRANIFTPLGKSTLAVYSLHMLFVRCDSAFRFSALFKSLLPSAWILFYILIAILATLLLSLKPFSAPFHAIMRIRFDSKRSK